MTSLTPLLLLLAFAAGPEVHLLRVDDGELTGTLESIAGESLTVITAGGESQSLPLADLKHITFPAVEPPSRYDDPPQVEVRLHDGSVFAGTGVEVSGQKVVITTEHLGEVTLPLPSLRSLRVGDIEGVADHWSELRGRQNTSDLLVVRKGDLLDFVEGSVGEVAASGVTFLLGDRTVTVPRDKIFGVVYAARETPAQRPVAEVHVQRSRLNATALSFRDGTWTARVGSDLDITLPVAALHQIDFANRVRFLHEMEAAIQFPETLSELDRPFWFRRGTASNGAPLRIAADEVIATRGLWMHSGVTARYRINRDYRTLAGIVGMDHNVEGNKSVRLRILGDGQPLFDEILAWTDPVRELNLDVSGVRDLEIRAERLPEIAEQDPFGIKEHVSLGNLRLIR